MPTEREIVDAYTRRALLLLRVARGLGADANMPLRALGRQLRGLLADADFTAMGRRDLSTLLRSIDAAVQDSYNAITAQQGEALAALIDTDAAWATHASDLSQPAPDGARSGILPGLLVMGLPWSRLWQRQATNLSDRIAAAVRTAVATGQDAAQVMAAVIGQGPRGRERGGILAGARQQSATLADTAAHAAAYAGRQSAWKAGGVKYLKWHSILDSRTTLGCAARAGKVYTVDFQPVGHDIPIDRPPPRHWNCRSILVAMGPGYEPPGDGQDPYSESLDAWLKRQPGEAQDEMLGPTRAALWRAGKLDTRGLLGPGGESLSVAQLARTLPDDAKVMLWTGEAKYQQLVGELTQAMRVAGEKYGLAEYHMVALRHYTGNGYEAMNAALREGRIGLSTSAADVLNEALGKLPAHAGTVVRRANLPDDVLAKYVPGDIVDEDAFTSATRGAKDMFPNRPHRLVIHGLTGRDISLWSAYNKSELEVLFGAPRRFRIERREAMDGFIEIELWEVDL